jgi:hypothetical protein
MFIIDLTLKNTPVTLSVQRKTQEDAAALYKQISDTLGGTSRVLELTCEKQEDKKISVLTSEIVAVQLTEKNSGGGGAKVPGFLAIPTE